MPAVTPPPDTRLRSTTYPLVHTLDSERRQHIVRRPVGRRAIAREQPGGGEDQRARADRGDVTRSRPAIGQERQQLRCPASPRTCPLPPGTNSTSTSGGQSSSVPQVGTSCAPRSLLTGVSVFATRCTFVDPLSTRCHGPIQVEQREARVQQHRHGERFGRRGERQLARHARTLALSPRLQVARMPKTARFSPTAKSARARVRTSARPLDIPNFAPADMRVHHRMTQRICPIIILHTQSRPRPAHLAKVSPRTARLRRPRSSGATANPRAAVRPDETKVTPRARSV